MSTINLKILPPCIPGTAYARTLQGNTSGGIAGTGFLSSDTLTATISPGQGLASLFSPTVAWFDAASCQFTVTMTAAQTTGLAIDDNYLLEVFAARGGGDRWPVAAAYLPTLPVAGSQAAATPPDLVTLPYAVRLLGSVQLTEPQWESVPDLISASSTAFRSFCNRSFTQATYIEELPVITGATAGTIRLRETPVNWIQRIQCRPTPALTVSNGTADAAWVYLQASGDASVWSNLTITGLVLNWESGGVVSNTPVVYSSLADQRLNTLASAIVAVGSGWTASAPTLGNLPVSELMDGLASKGAGPADQPFGAAVFHVYEDNITTAQFDPDDGQNTGIVWVGRQGADAAMRWGPGGEMLFDIATPAWGRVKTTYNGGFAAIPEEIQLAVVELVKYQLFRLKAPLGLVSETADKYSYTIDRGMLHALPPWVIEVLYRYRITNA